MGKGNQDYKLCGYEYDEMATTPRINNPLKIIEGPDGRIIDYYLAEERCGLHRRGVQGVLSEGLFGLPRTPLPSAPERRLPPQFQGDPVLPETA